MSKSLNKQIRAVYVDLLERMKDFYELFYNDEGEWCPPREYKIREKLSARHVNWNITRINILHPINDKIKELKSKETEKD